MTPLLLVAGFLIASAVVSSGTLLLGEFLLDEAVATALEWILSLALVVLLFILGSRHGLDPTLAAALALAGSVAQFAIEAALAWTAEAVAGIGAEWEGLTPHYPVGAAAAVLVVFPPVGLGELVGAPDLFRGLGTIYAVGVGAGALVLAVHAWLALRFDERAGRIVRWILTLAVLAAAQKISAESVDAGRALVANAVLATVLAGLAASARYLSLRVVELEVPGWTARLDLAIWLGGLGLLLVGWLSPLLFS